LVFVSSDLCINRFSFLCIKPLSVKDMRRGDYIIEVRFSDPLSSCFLERKCIFMLVP